MASKHLWATKLGADDTTAKEELGILRREWNTSDACFKTYRYIQAASDTTIADGTALGFSDALRQTASLDADDIEENQPLGVGIGVITASSYGWIQTGGYHSAVLTDAGSDFADGGNVRLHDTSDGVVEWVAAGTTGDTPLGIVVAAYSGSTVPVYLTLNEV